MNVGNLLELQRTFERNRVVNPSAEIEKIGVAEKLPRQVFVESRFVRLENCFDLLGNAREFLHQDFGGVFGQLAAKLAEIGSEQKQRGQLRSESLGGSHTDLRPSVRWNRAVGLARDHRTVHVSDLQRVRA